MTSNEENEIRKKFEQLLERGQGPAKQDTLIEDIKKMKSGNALSLLLFYWFDSYDRPDSNETQRQQKLLERVLTEVYRNDAQTLRDKCKQLQLVLIRTFQEDSNRMHS